MAYTILKLHKKPLLKMSLEDLREFLQEKTAASLQFEDDAVIEELQASMAELRKMKFDLPPPAKSEEFPKKPLGLEFSLNLVSVKPSVGGKGQKKAANDLDHEKDAVIRLSPDRSPPNLTETFNNSNLAIHKRALIPQPSGPLLQVELTDVYHNPFQNNQPIPNSDMEGKRQENRVQLLKEDAKKIPSEGFPATLDEIQVIVESQDLATAHKEKDSLDSRNIEERCSTQENNPSLSADDKGHVTPQVLEQAVIDVTSTENCPRDPDTRSEATESDLSVTSNSITAFVERDSPSQVPSLPSLEGQSTLESPLTVQNAAVLQDGSATCFSEDFLPEEAVVLPDHPCQPTSTDSSPLGHSLSTVCDVPKSSIVPRAIRAFAPLPLPFQDGKRRPSNVSQYDNLSEDGEEESPVRVPCSEELAVLLSQTELCDPVLKCRVHKSASAGELGYPQRQTGGQADSEQQPGGLERPLSFNILPRQKRPSSGGSMPILSELDSGGLLVSEDFCARPTSSPELQEQYSPFKIVKSSTPLHLAHATEQDFCNKKQMALPLLESSHLDAAGGETPIPPAGEAEGGTAGDSLQKSLNALSDSLAPQWPKPKLPLKIVKTHSDNNFHLSCLPTVQMSKSVTF
ncbi:PREDICTED: uncharacterized protein LOC107112056 [Gekko japonicus]|uniref:Uncharacterized protein LOC107112056 n=1 Tax=Gekko japonicus TaxID=146911 RepID=A0ABM1K4H2_GEKJA|nr:PREDICTED: uncharacterized protein LOC107112056 [Gekko japonicus]